MDVHIFPSFLVRESFAVTIWGLIAFAGLYRYPCRFGFVLITYDMYDACAFYSSLNMEKKKHNLKRKYYLYPALFYCFKHL